MILLHKKDQKDLAHIIFKKSIKITLITIVTPVVLAGLVLWWVIAQNPDASRGFGMFLGMLLLTTGALMFLTFIITFILDCRSLNRIASKEEKSKHITPCLRLFGSSIWKIILVLCLPYILMIAFEIYDQIYEIFFPSMW